MLLSSHSNRSGKRRLSFQEEQARNASAKQYELPAKFFSKVYASANPKRNIPGEAHFEPEETKKYGESLLLAFIGAMFTTEEAVSAARIVVVSTPAPVVPVPQADSLDLKHPPPPRSPSPPPIDLSHPPSPTEDDDDRDTYSATIMDDVEEKPSTPSSPRRREIERIIASRPPIAPRPEWAMTYLEQADWQRTLFESIPKDKLPPNWPLYSTHLINEMARDHPPTAYHYPPGGGKQIVTREKGKTGQWQYHNGGFGHGMRLLAFIRSSSLPADEQLSKGQYKDAQRDYYHILRVLKWIKLTGRYEFTGLGNNMVKHARQGVENRSWLLMDRFNIESDLRAASLVTGGSYDKMFTGSVEDQISQFYRMFTQKLVEIVANKLVKETPPTIILPPVSTLVPPKPLKKIKHKGKKDAKEIDVIDLSDEPPSPPYKPRRNKRRAARDFDTERFVNLPTDRTTAGVGQDLKARFNRGGTEGMNAITDRIKKIRRARRPEIYPPEEYDNEITLPEGKLDDMVDEDDLKDEKELDWNKAFNPKKYNPRFKSKKFGGAIKRKRIRWDSDDDGDVDTKRKTFESADYDASQHPQETIPDSPPPTSPPPSPPPKRIKRDKFQDFQNSISKRHKAFKNRQPIVASGGPIAGNEQPRVPQSRKLTRNERKALEAANPPPPPPPPPPPVPVPVPPILQGAGGGGGGGGDPDPNPEDGGGGNDEKDDGKEDRKDEGKDDEGKYAANVAAFKDNQGEYDRKLLINIRKIVCADDPLKVSLQQILGCDENDKRAAPPDQIDSIIGITSALGDARNS